MKNLCLSLAVISQAIIINIRASEAVEMDNFEEISGRSFLAIQSALPELAKYNLSVINYNVSVRAQKSSIIVVFKDPKQPPYVFGSAGDYPGFAVELTSDGDEVIRSYFMK
jgi:hypothetical protein